MPRPPSRVSLSGPPTITSFPPQPYKSFEPRPPVIVSFPARIAPNSERARFSKVTRNPSTRITGSPVSVSASTAVTDERSNEDSSV